MPQIQSAMLRKNKNSFPRNKRASSEHPNTREILRLKVIFDENNKWQETTPLGNRYYKSQDKDYKQPIFINE